MYKCIMVLDIYIRKYIYVCNQCLDGLIEDNTIVEIKCPFSAKNTLNAIDAVVICIYY
jgi:hypothetical protein